MIFCNYLKVTKGKLGHLEKRYEIDFPFITSMSSRIIQIQIIICLFHNFMKNNYMFLTPIILHYPLNMRVYFTGNKSWQCPYPLRLRHWSAAKLLYNLLTVRVTD